jgi:hypothetical protein
MARYAGTVVEFPEIKQIRLKLQARFAPRIRAKFLGAALRKATEPAKKALKATVRSTHKSVSGNLLRSVSSVVRRYPKSGNAVGLVGFQKAGTGKTTPTGGTIQKGKDRAFHAGLITFGTKDRRAKGAIASSYNTRGPFTIKGRAKRGKFAGSTRVRTVPKSPKAFFKRAPAGGKAFLGRVRGTDPIAAAFRQSTAEIRRVLREQMSDVVERAARFLEMDFPPRNRS